MSTNVRQRLGDEDSASIQVDLSPAQGGDFAGPQPAIGRQSNPQAQVGAKGPRRGLCAVSGSAEGWASNRFRQALGLGGCQNMHLDGR
jgi:hypothetical protein